MIGSWGKSVGEGSEPSWEGSRPQFEIPGVQGGVSVLSGGFWGSWTLLWGPRCAGVVPCPHFGGPTGSGERSLLHLRVLCEDIGGGDLNACVAFTSVFGWGQCFWVSHHQLLLTVALGWFLGCFVLPHNSPCRDIQLVLGLLCAASKLCGEAEDEWSRCWPHHATSTTQEQPQVVCEQAMPSAGRASVAPFEAKE